jgi:hypothetical protein
MQSPSPASVSTETGISPSDLEDGRYVPTEKVLNPDVLNSQDDDAFLDEYTA